MSRERARRTPLLWSLVLSLASLVCWEAERLAWWPQGAWWALAPALASVVFILRWFVVGRTLTARVLAQQLDAEWALQARLESSVELQEAKTALAAAQRSDAQEHAQTHRPPRVLEWALGLTALVVVAFLVLGELGVEVHHKLWVHRPVQANAFSPEKTTLQAQTKPRDLSGKIIWRSPESEIKATAIEEVPLVAVAESSEGYKKLTLEIALNGEPRLSRPIEPSLLMAAGKPGPHTISFSMYLDEVDAQEFDSVSYFLRGEIAAEAAAVVSPLQFVQIRPSREDVAAEAGTGNDNDAKMVNVLRRLKIAQLELMKENFQLANVANDHGDPAWRESNTQIAADQAALSEKTKEFRGVAIKEAAPIIVVDNLDQAIPLMRDAAKDIAATSNEAGGKKQGKALALITAIEKILRKSMSAGAPPDVDDPFKDKQKYALPDRPKTPAGRLEELARKQEKIAQALNESSIDQVVPQSDVSRELDRLLADKELDPDVQIEVAAAAKDASEANRQLAQNDVMAARGPATAAAEALAHAVAEQERKGRQTALAQFDQMRRELNQAARQADSSERDAELDKLAAELAQAAGTQQKKGSSAAAEQMSAASKEAREAAGGEGSAGKSGTQQLAETLAKSEAELGGRSAALSRTAHLLERVDKELADPANASSENALNEAQLAAQVAGVILGDTPGRALAGEIVSAIKADPKGGVGPAFATLKEKIHKLSALINEAQARGNREEMVRRFNPDEFDPAYRSAIDAYFERLSREGTH